MLKPLDSRYALVWTFLEASAPENYVNFSILRSSPNLLIHGPKWPKKHSPGFTLG
jgi:hypothetical protein